MVDSKLGFLKPILFAKSSLKCTPLVFSSRNRLKRSFAAGSGEPGGDGGREVAGNGACVK